MAPLSAQRTRIYSHRICTTCGENGFPRKLFSVLRLPRSRVVAPLARTENRQSHVPTRREPTRERYSIHANIDWTTRGPATHTTIPDTTGYSLDTWSKQVQCSGTSAEKACQPAQPVRQSRPAVSESILILLHEDDLQPWKPSAPARSLQQRDQLGNANACCAVAARHRRTQSAA